MNRRDFLKSISVTVVGLGAIALGINNLPLVRDRGVIPLKEYARMMGVNHLPIWEGYVNKTSLSLGSLQKSRNIDMVLTNGDNSVSLFSNEEQAKLAEMIRANQALNFGIDIKEYWIG